MKEICFAIKYLQWGSGGKNVIRGGRYNLYTLNKRIVWGVSGVKKNKSSRHSAVERMLK